MSEPAPRTRKRPRKAVGPERPHYLRAEDCDTVMAVVLALMSEVASLRQRLDSHERLAAAGIAATPAALEAYRPDPQADAERDAWRAAYVRRMLRVVLEDLEPGAAPPGPEVPE